MACALKTVVCLHYFHVDEHTSRVIIQYQSFFLLLHTYWEEHLQKIIPIMCASQPTKHYVCLPTNKTFCKIVLLSGGNTFFRMMGNVSRICKRIPPLAINIELLKCKQIIVKRNKHQWRLSDARHVTFRHVNFLALMKLAQWCEFCSTHKKGGIYKPKGKHTSSLTQTTFYTFQSVQVHYCV